MTGPHDSAVNGLCATVQHNCSISDARFARNYSMCVYLLRMREFYRWKQAIPLGAAIDSRALGDWVSDTESWWDSIEETNFKPISIRGADYDPFDVNSINRALKPDHVFYGAGLGRHGQPHFVLARRKKQSTTGSAADCIECGDEFARDTMTLPAMAQNGTIIIRHDSIVRMLWQMVDEWRVRKPSGPMARIVSQFDIDNNSHSRLEAAASELSALLLHHELGEISAGTLLGSSYCEMTFAFQGYRDEAYIRAVRDLLADSLSSWPFIVQQQSVNHLDFWLAGLNGIREELLKQTSLYEQLFQGSHSARLTALSRSIDAEQSRWHHVATQLLEQFHLCGRQFNVEQTVTDNLSI